MMDVLHPNVPEPTLAAMAHTRPESDGDDTSRVVNILTGGQHYFVELHSSSDCQWFISALEIRAAP
jgi:hypothetical protein